MAWVVAVEALVIALLGLLVVGLLRSHTEILAKLHALEAGTGSGGAGAGAGGAGPVAAREASDVTGETLAGEVIRVGVAGARHDTLLAFLTSGCFTCIGFWDRFRSGRRLRVPGGARLVIVTKGPEAESPSKLAEIAPPDHALVLSTRAWEQYGVEVAPWFAYVDGPSGRVVASGAASDWDQVVEMWSKAVEGRGEGGRAREHTADQKLLAAGVHPGDPSLYPPDKES